LECLSDDVAQVGREALEIYPVVESMGELVE
jgi:hypothetical protein